MRAWSRVAIAAVVVASAAAIAPRAEACGGCFVPPGPSTQVSAHRMAFAVSPTRTILWDQIQYQGAPSSFGWVLPIRDKVDVGVSSDELFQRLETSTQAVITPPPRPECNTKHLCKSCGGEDYASGVSPNADVDGGVDVWGTNVVGPYEATQLSATDSTALRTWLTSHGYALPDAITPVVDQYVKEGFGFLAIKLVPKADTSRMVPIRVAFDGNSPVLPLRMVAAGTGSFVGIKLFVFGEGRWEAANFPNAEIATKDLVWDFRASSSNFGQLESSLVTNAPRTWITETADDYSRSVFFDGLPPGTTENDAGVTVFATATDQTEMERAFPGRTHLTVTRLFAQLPSSALADDLTVQASTGARIPQSRQAPNSVNACQDVVYECCSSGVIDCATPPRDETSSTRRFGWMGLGALGLAAVGAFRARRRPRV